NSVGEFYSVALTNNYQQADTGTKMIHIGRNTTSTIVAKGISAGHGQQTYRGQVLIMKNAEGARNYSQCDSLLLGDKCGAHTFPYIEVRNSTAKMEHEASTSKIGEDQLFYCQQRGISAEDAVSMIVNGFCREVFRELPMEFAVEAQKLKLVELDESCLNRGVNEGFSGGEKKRNEIFQMAVLDPKLAILDETDSGLDIDALRIVAEGVNALRSEKHSVLVITHYQRL